MAHLPGAPQRAERDTAGRLVEKWKFDATSPPLEDFASCDHRAIRPPASELVGGVARIPPDPGLRLPDSRRLPRSSRNEIRAHAAAIAFAHSRRHRKC